MSQPAREKSVRLLLDRVQAREPRAPAIVTGDFNTGEANVEDGVEVVKADILRSSRDNRYSSDRFPVVARRRIP